MAGGARRPGQGDRAELTWLDFEPRDDETRHFINLACFPLEGEYDPPWQIIREQMEPPEWDHPHWPRFAMRRYN